MCGPRMQKHRVLIVEDEQDIAGLIKHSLERSGGAEAEIVGSGDAALKAVAARPPDLIILDLNLPRKDGREVLAEIKQDPALMMIPVVVLTTSKADEDVARAYQSHANCFITKPVGFANFHEVMKSIERYWFAVATLPP